MNSERRDFLKIIGSAAVLLASSGCGARVVEMENINAGVKPNVEKTGVKPDEISLASKSMLVLPDRSLGLEPTEDVRLGNISAFMQFFPKRLYAGEWFPGRLRWDTWTIASDGSEHFGQIIFSGMHTTGHYSGTNVIDGQVVKGTTVILSTALDYIYSPVGKELSVDSASFIKDPQYRRKKIMEVNTAEDGSVLKLSPQDRVDDFKWFIKSFNQLRTPEGYLLTPYGQKEVATIRGINPQYSYFEKLIGTGKLALRPAGDPASLAIVNSIGILMDMIGAANAPSTGWDFSSQISRRQMGFVVEYALTLAEKEIEKRDNANARLLGEKPK